jgi:TPR repeat protein
LLTQAFQAGNATAATYLGVLYFFGAGVKEDKVAAERWFESALKLHDPLAAFNLGSLYSVETDHPHDIPKAAELLRQAVDAGYVPAMHSLGLLLVNHPELSQNPQQSHALLEAAANAGSWKSSVALAVLARDGRGVPVDPKAAYFHFRIATLQGGHRRRNS